VIDRLAHGQCSFETALPLLRKSASFSLSNEIGMFGQKDGPTKPLVYVRAGYPKDNGVLLNVKFIRLTALNTGSFPAKLSRSRGSTISCKSFVCLSAISQNHD